MIEPKAVMSDSKPLLVLNQQHTWHPKSPSSNTTNTGETRVHVCKAESTVYTYSVNCVYPTPAFHNNSTSAVVPAREKVGHIWYFWSNWKVFR